MDKVNFHEQTVADEAKSTTESPAPSTPVADSKIRLPITPKSTPETQKSISIFGPESGITDKNSQITGSILPTSRPVLHCMILHSKTVSLHMKQNGIVRK